MTPGARPARTPRAPASPADTPGSRRWPRVSALRWDDAHRLIPAVHADTDEPILEGLSGRGADANDLVDLAAATNARLMAQADALPGGIRRDELVFGVPHWRIINAAFCHPHPQGSRFNGPERGAWYAGQHVETSIAEVSHHRTVDLAEIGRWELDVEYQDYLADVHAPMHDLRGPRDRRARAALDPDSYVASQALAADLLADGSLGVVYPAVRDPGRDAVACFRPALVGNVRPGARYRLRWSGSPQPTITELRRRRVARG
ncbi:MAG TPA: RES family NAD+ phosphorylase [Candidatus Nanopelagicales bacterium]